MAEQDSADLRALARLYELERQERDERRGLEQRAATTFAASIVAAGLAVNGLGSSAGEVGVTSGTMVVIGVALLLLGSLGTTIFLAGTPGGMFDVFRAKPPATPVEREPADLEATIEQALAAVNELRASNRSAVFTMRLASWCSGTGFYAALIGVLIFVVF